MRLLHFDTLGELSLTDFRGKPIPPYAILSHRWTDCEVLMEDILNRKYKEKEEGVKKLLFCAKQADRDGLQYFWIDTCCIDRWDHHERSKAINSMFQWYSNAARCYVFLSDVSITEMVPCSDWKAAFRASAWFTRGWTLQELIAPTSVDFFSREGNHIGDKESLIQLLYDCTGIPLAALRNCPLAQFTTSERRRWAENRTTSEEEDIVYCLLGLLSVSMPTSYGEKKEGAMRRLQAELGAVSSSAPSIIPFSQNELFVGRETQLAEIKTALFSNEQTTTMIAVVGPGGIGKSQLALEAAHSTRLDNKNCSVFWVDASNTDSLCRSYASIAQKLSIPGYDDDQTDIEQIVKHCLAEINTRHCLLVFDNAEGTTVRRSGSGSSMRDVADWAEFLPDSKLCSVIVTTTDRGTAEALAPHNVIAVDKLTPGMALRILQNCLAKPLSRTEQQRALHLLKELSYLPLLVSQAAACINASNMTLQQYQSQLDRHKERVHENEDNWTGGEQQESGLRKIVAATLSLSMGQIRRSNTLAARYLYSIACVDRKDILLDLLDETSLKAREDAVKLLDRYALVTRRPAESALDIHRLVHKALREQLRAQGQLQDWIQRTITQLLWVFPNSNNHSSRSKWRRLLPHTEYVLSRSKISDDKERSDLAHRCCVALFSDGRYQEAEELGVQVVATRTVVLGREHPDTLASINNLAIVLDSQGKYEEAEVMHRQTVARCKKVLGREHPDTLTSMNNLANVLNSQGKYEEAEAMHRQTVVMCKKVLGREHHSTLASMNNLAYMLDRQGKYKEAEAMHRQTVVCREKMLGHEHPDTLTSMNNLARVLDSQGKYEEAEAMHRQTVVCREKVLGREHPDTLTSINNLAIVLNRQGRYEEAEAMHRQTVVCREKMLGHEHPDTLTSMNNLATVLDSQGKYEEAEVMHRQTVVCREKALGHEHPSTLASMNNLARVLDSQGKYEEAEVMHRQTVARCKKVLGREHPNTLTSMNNLARVLDSQGKHEEAEAMHRQTVVCREKALGREHPDTLTSMNNLARVLDSQGKYEEAEVMHRQTLADREKILGREHPDTLDSLYDLARLLAKQRDYEGSLCLYNMACDGYSVVLGEHHPTTHACRQHYTEALALREQSQAVSSSEVPEKAM